MLAALLPCVAFAAIASAQTDPYRSGDFSALLGHSRPLVIIDPACDCPFPNNIIPRSRLLPNGAWPEDIFRANQVELADSSRRRVLSAAQGYSRLMGTLVGSGSSDPRYYERGHHPRGHLNPKDLEESLDGLTRAEVNGGLVNTDIEGSGARGRGGWTALHFAAQGRGPGIVQLLLDSGANVNARADDGRTPLHLAARDQPEIVRLLLDSGAAVDARADLWTTKGWTPLLLARSLESFQVLQAAGADVRARTDHGYTVLHAAAQVADAATVEALIAAGLDPNAEEYGLTPLLRAGSRETFEALLAGGADLGPIESVFAPDGLEAVRREDISSSLLLTAVRQVGRFASASLVARLRAINPDFAEVPNRADPSAFLPTYPLHYAAQFNDDPAMIAALSTSNVNVTTPGARYLPLFLAAGYNGNPAVIEAIIKALPASQSYVDRSSSVRYYTPSPLYLAAASPSPRATEIVGMLLEAGADVKGREGFYPLYAAAMTQNLAAMELLIAAGSDVNAVWPGEAASLLGTVLERGRFDCGYLPVAVALRAAGAVSVSWTTQSAGSNPDGSNRYTYRTHPYVPGPQVVECETVSVEIQGVSAEVEELIDSGTDLDTQDSRGFTAVLRAAATDMAGDIAALATAGANVNAATPVRRLTPLHVAVWRRAGLATVQALLAAGADVDAVDRLFGATALHRAAGDNRTEPPVVTALLAAGADPNARDNFRRTPLDNATRVGVNNEAIADLLRAAGGTCRSCDAP